MSLTKYKSGSLKELWAISYPLMLSSFSMMLMLFIDRLMLAYYSQDALNASVTAGTLAWTFLIGIMVVTNIAEVFVAQHNGAGRPKKLGEPVWQMIWLSAATVIFFFPMANVIGSWIFANSPIAHLQLEYFYWVMLFGPLYAAYGAVSSFFIGKGDIKIITILAIVSNLVNTALDATLIFGIEGWIPSFGVTGAAIATNFSELFQVIILFSIFIRRKNREAFGTGCFQLKWKPFFQCIKIGIPAGFFVGFEIFGWAIYYHLLEQVSLVHITIAGVCQSVLLLFYFFGEGLCKGATTIAGNLIGSGKKHLVGGVLKNGFILQSAFSLSLLIVFVFSSDWIIHLFVGREAIAQSPEFLFQLKTCIHLMAIYIFFEGMRFLVSGILTGAGDTKFLLVMGALGIWFLLVIPVYYFIVIQEMNILIAQAIMMIHCSTLFLVYCYRLTSNRWQEVEIFS